MTVLSVVKDPEARTVTVTARFDAPVDRVWQAWSDPRKLERWWGPPDFPATVTEHDLTPGGAVAYFMTGPDGARHGGAWRIKEVEAPHVLAFEDVFTDGDGPTGSIRVELSNVAGGTQMVVVATWASDESLRQIIATGTDTGMAAAIGQIDALLTDPRSTP